MPTLGELVEQTLGQLNQYRTNRSQVATFTGWQTDGGGDKTGINMSGVPAGAILTDAVVELDTELVYVSSHDPSNGSTVCPPWFRQQNGTPANDSFAVNSKVTIDPRWPRYHVAETVVAGINSLYPDLFGVKVTTLDSVSVNGNYEVPADCDGVLHVSIQNVAPGFEELVIREWSLDLHNPDGKRYLRIRPIHVAGHRIKLTYRAKPTIPVPATLSTTWASTGLPESAADLPVLYATSVLVSTAEAAKTQTSSVEQSDRSRFVQGGAANAASRRFTELFEQRLKAERRKLLTLYPPRVHKLLNG
jgi:hypothetical protein